MLPGDLPFSVHTLVGCVQAFWGTASLFYNSPLTFCKNLTLLVLPLQSCISKDA